MVVFSASAASHMKGHKATALLSDLIKSFHPVFEPWNNKLGGMNAKFAFMFEYLTFRTAVVRMMYHDTLTFGDNMHRKEESLTTFSSNNKVHCTPAIALLSHLNSLYKL